MKRMACVSITILALTASLFAQHADWQIRTTSEGTIDDGSLMDIEGDSLVVFSPGFNGKLDVKSIERLRRGNNRTLEGSFAGFLIGGAIGYTIGDKTDVTTEYSSSSSSDSDKKIASAFIGGAAGGILGGLVGMSASKDIYRLEYETPEEKLASVKMILFREGRLRKPDDQTLREIVYLKNGSIVRGTIVELIPDSTVRILTADSSVFVFTMAEVSRISKEDVSSEVSPAPSSGLARKNSPPPPFTHSVSFGINAGMGIPIGEFAETSGSAGGAADPGFTIGADVAYGVAPTVDWISSLYFSFNEVNENVTSGFPSGLTADIGPWFLVWPMTGIRVISPKEQTVRFFGLGQVGLLAGSSPKATVTYQGVSATQPSSNATSIAFSIGLGMISHEHFSCSLRYLWGNPEYEYTASSASVSISGKANQSTSVFVVVLGFVF